MLSSKERRLLFLLKMAWWKQVGVIAVKTLEILPDHTSSKGHSSSVKNYSKEVNLESASVMRSKTEWYKMV